MKHKENLCTVIAILVATILVVVLAWIETDKYLAFKEKELKVKTMEVCGKNAIRSYEEGTKKSIETEKSFYKKCLKDMGYNTQVE